jgi:hypothetical protein
MAVRYNCSFIIFFYYIHYNELKWMYLRIKRISFRSI